MTPTNAAKVLNALLAIADNAENPMDTREAIAIMREEVASTRSLTAELKAVTAELEAIKVAGYYSGEAAPQAPAEPISDAEIERVIDAMSPYSGRYEVACVRAVLALLEKVR